MTHIMVPDGVLPPWLWISGWIAAAGCLAVAIWATRDSDRARMVPLAAVMAAVMTVVMSLEILPLAYEPHLTVLSGILLGPAYGFLATFAFMIARMLLGDGAITLLGLNALLLGFETVAGFYLFRLFTRGRVNGPATGFAAGAATFVSLGLATLLFLGVVALGLNQLEGLEVAEEVLDRVGVEPAAGAFPVFAQFVLLFGAVGWLIESAVTAAIVGFLRTVRPSMLAERAHA